MNGGTHSAENPGYVELVERLDAAAYLAMRLGLDSVRYALLDAVDDVKMAAIVLRFNPDTAASCRWEAPQR